jgi:hypothetical protein
MAAGFVQWLEPDGTTWTIPLERETAAAYEDLSAWVGQVKADRAERLGWARPVQVVQAALPEPPVTGRYDGAAEWARGGGQRIVDGDVVVEWTEDDEQFFEPGPNRLAGVGAFVLFALAIIVLVWAGSGAVPGGS